MIALSRSSEVQGEKARGARLRRFSHQALGSAQGCGSTSWRAGTAWGNRCSGATGMAVVVVTYQGHHRPRASTRVRVHRAAIARSSLTGLRLLRQETANTCRIRSVRRTLGDTGGHRQTRPRSGEGWMRSEAHNG
jgi:hypothetical protein